MVYAATAFGRGGDELHGSQLLSAFQSFLPIGYLFDTSLFPSDPAVGT